MLGIALATLFSAFSLGLKTMTNPAFSTWIPILFFFLAGISALATIIILLFPFLKRLPFMQKNGKSILTIGAFLIVLIILASINPFSNWIETRNESHPTPQEIINDIYKELPSLQETLEQNYQSQPVRWTVTFQSLTNNDDGTQQIYTNPIGDNPLFISLYFTIDSKTYPQFNTMEIGTRINVEGNIVSVSLNSITINVAQLTFPESNN